MTSALSEVTKINERVMLIVVMQRSAVAILKNSAQVRMMLLKRN